MRRIAQAIALVSLILIFVGTAFAGGQSEDGEPTEAEDSGKETVTFWHFPQIRNVPGYEDVSEEYGDWWEHVAGQYMEENPDVEIETELLPWEGGVDKINVAISGDNPPDLVFDYLGRSGNWYQQGAAVAVDDLVSQDLKDDILDSFKDIYTIDGDLHAVPGFSWNMNINVNVGLLRDIGIEGEILNGPGEPYTFEQFTDLLREIDEKAPDSIHPFGIGAGSEQADYIWWGFFWGFDGFLYDEDGTVTDDPSGIVDGYEYLKSLGDEGLLAPGVASMTASDVINLWSEGRVAVMWGQKFHAQEVKESIDEGVVDFEYEIMPAPFPSEDGESGYTAIGPTGFIVMSEDERKQEILGDFIDFAMQPEYWTPTVKGSGQFPALESVAEEDIYEGDEYQEVVQMMLSEYPAVDFGLSSPNYNEIRGALSQAGQAIFSDRQSPEEAVETFLETVRGLEE